jgi:hypothetical protein
MLKTLREAGYPIEQDVMNEGNMVVTFPVAGEEGIRTESEVTMEEQFERVALLQQHYADNQISVTIKFRKDAKGVVIKKYSKLLLKTKTPEELKTLLGHAFKHRSTKYIQKMFETYANADLESKDSFRYPPNHRCFHYVDYHTMIYVLDSESKYSLVCPHPSCSISDHYGNYHKPNFELENKALIKLIVSTHIADLLAKYQSVLKCVSLFPMDDDETVYPQAPYESITREEYEALKRSIRPITCWETMPQPEAPFGCEGDSCMIKSSLSTSSS